MQPVPTSNITSSMRPRSSPFMLRTVSPVTVDAHITELLAVSTASIASIASPPLDACASLFCLQKVQQRPCLAGARMQRAHCTGFCKCDREEGPRLRGDDPENFSGRL